MERETDLLMMDFIYLLITIVSRFATCGGTTSEDPIELIAEFLNFMCFIGNDKKQ